MAQGPQSVKRVAITKANAQVVGIVGIAAFISVFCLVACQALWSQNAYLGKVAGVKNKAHAQLLTNIKASSSLADSYRTFTSTDKNAIGGSTKGAGDNDGDNAKLILDALPSTYDFPALTSSIEKILTTRNLHVTAITGTDDEVAQQTAAASANPQPVSMAYSFSIKGANYAAVQDLVKSLQLSIRPMWVDSITLSGGANNMQLSVTAHTYFQPPKTVSISKKVVK